MATDSLNIVDIDDRFYWSLNQLQKAFGSSRETISKRLRKADIQAVKKRGGFDVYHIANAAKAILADELPNFEDGGDPDKFPPKARLDWYKSQNEKMKCQREAQELIPIDDVTQELATVVKVCVHTIETLPDILEMKCQLSPEAVKLVETECDSAREQLAKRLEE